MSLRILQVLRAPVGGLFRHVADLTRELATRGHAVGVVVDALSSDALSQGRLKALEPVAALGIHMMKMPRLIGPGDFTVPGKLRRLAGELQIDVLHGHGAKGGLHARLARSEKQAAIYTPHGGVLHFSPRSAQGMIFTTIERALMSRTDTIVFESQFAEAAYARQIAVPKCPSVVVHNGVTESEFIPVKLEPDAADFVFVGELRELKGIFVLVEALFNLPAATLVMAGDGASRAALEARIADLGIAGRVKLLGAQPARSVFAKGRTVIVPSLAESLPYIVLEAAAAGRPVIATNVGGIPEIFGPTAEDLIPPGDADALARAMSEAKSNPGLADAQALVRLAHVAGGFSVKAMADGIEAVYGQALATRRR